MRIGVLSDLYLDELGPLPAPEDQPDVLVLAGNIARGMKGIEWAVQTYSCTILYVLGSNAYHGHDIDTFETELRSIAWGSNFHLLQNETLIIRGVRFIGATLWTDYNLFGNVEVAARLAAMTNEDFKLIVHTGGRPIVPADLIALNHEAVGYLWRTATKPYDDGSTVVITHHAPSMRSVLPAYRGDLDEASFASNLDELVVAADAKYWIHGAQPAPVDYALGNTRVIANPRGYFTGGGVIGVPAFDPNYTIEM